jgi:hypothetical protein
MRREARHSTKRDSSSLIRVGKTDELVSRRFESAINHHPAETSSTHRRQHEQGEELSIMNRFSLPVQDIPVWKKSTTQRLNSVPQRQPRKKIKNHANKETQHTKPTSPRRCMTDRSKSSSVAPSLQPAPHLAISGERTKPARSQPRGTAATRPAFVRNPLKPR